MHPERALVTAVTRVTATLSHTCCESLQAFTADQLVQLQRTLFAAREPRLQQVYASTADNRRLGAVGHLTESLEEMERLWSQERGGDR